MTADTEEIIDLTDLIEEGVPSPQASRSSAEKDSLAEQLQSLNDVPHTSGSAIDSLLQEAGQGAAAPETVEELHSPSLSGPNAPSQGPDENPNERIVMPGIDDVDALLNHLDIPSQPHTTTSAPIEEGAALDSAVEDLLSSAGVKVPPVAAAKSTITEPGFMLSTISLVTRRGAGLPGIRAVVMTRSVFLSCSAMAFCCRF